MSIPNKEAVPTTALELHSDESVLPSVKSRNLIQRAVFCAGIAFFILVLLHLAGAALHATTGIALFIGTALLLRIGDLVLNVANVGPLIARLPVAFCIGVTTVSLAMLPIVWLANITAATAFILVCVVFLALGSLKSARPESNGSVREWLDVFVALAFAALVCWFCRGVASALPDLYETGTLKAWVDYYIHAGQIAKFGDPLAVGPSDIGMFGAPRAFYHYGMFMLPAALVSLSGLPGLGLATAVLLPFGLLVGCLGTYALAAELGGRRVGMFATLAVICLPDASHYWLKNGFFGFHWLLFTAPGSGYAIGIGSVALALASRWLSAREAKAANGELILVVFLTVALIMIRAHMFILEAPALVGLVILAVWPKLRWRLIVAGSLAFVAIFAILALDQHVRDVWLSYSQAERFIDTIFEKVGSATYAGFYATVLTRYGRAAFMAVGVGSLIIASLGVFVVIYVLASVTLARRHVFQVRDATPMLLLATFILLVLFSPVAYNGDATEYKQRHFVLLYSVFGVYSVCLFARLFRGEASCNPLRRFGVISALFVLTAFICAFASRHTDPAKPEFTGGGGFYGVSADRELLHAARYIRMHSAAGDTFAIGGSDSRQWLFDSATIVTSLTDLPAYLSRSAFQLKMGGVTAEIAAQRIKRIEEVDRVKTLDGAMRLLRDAHVTWYLVPRQQATHWDPQGEQASYKNAGVFVYQVPLSGP